MRSFQKRENIGEQLRKIMVEQNFHELLDTQFSWGSEFKDIWKDVPPLNQLEEKAEGFVDYLREKKHELFGGTYPPIKQMPNVDLSVIEIDRDGYVSAAGNAVLSPHYSEGKVLIPDENFSTVGNLDWTAWDEDEWAAEGGKGTKSLTPGNSSSGETFMLPFPGSMLKLMVGFGILQLVDQGKTALDELYSYQPTGGNSVCKGSSSRPVRDYFDPMITSSDNYSTCALIKMLHDRGAVDKMNSDFEKWGLKLLSFKGSDPANGGHWIGAQMSSFDTARLLLIISGVEGELWESPSGITVTKDVLSASSREYFMSLLGRQGHNERLSTTSWCGADYPAPGIPSRVADEWVDQETGFVTVGSRQYGRDVRPCNKNAEVTFSHKSGWTEINSSDAGEVQSLEGQDWRRYIIAYTSNLSKRFIDPHKPADVDVLQTEKVGKMGKEVDLMMKRRGKY